MAYLGSRIAASALFVLPMLGGAALADGDPSRGLTVARGACQQCHVIEMGGRGSDAVPTFHAIANTPGMTDSRVRGFIMHPHPDMPQYPLTQQEIDDLAAYIWSLQE